MDGAMSPARRVPLVERFWAKVSRRADGCWVWTGAKTGGGYGAIQTDAPRRVLLLAHRVSYELHVGPIPEGLTIDHLCRNRACVNPEHLEPVTQRENTARSPNYAGNRTHCPHGHPYDADNTFVDKRGKRYCRTCQRAQARRYEERKRHATTPV